MNKLFVNPVSQKQILNRSIIYNNSMPLRGIKLHEYQAGRLLQKYKVPIPLGNVAFNGKEAYLVAR